MTSFWSGLALMAVLGTVTMVVYDYVPATSDEGFLPNPQVHVEEKPSPTPRIEH